MTGRKIPLPDWSSASLDHEGDQLKKAIAAADNQADQSRFTRELNLIEREQQRRRLANVGVLPKV